MKPATQYSRDPFAMTADPARYVPREATRRALSELARAVLEGRNPVAFAGPTGIGKTLLMRVLALRIEKLATPVFLPYPALEVEDLCAWALEILGHRVQQDSPLELLSAARQLGETGRPLVLMIDDAAYLPAATAERLAQLVRASEGDLRLLVAIADDLGPSETLAALGPDAPQIRLAAPMKAGETRTYILERLDDAGIGRTGRWLFDDARIAEIHRRSEGIPRRIHQLAGELWLDFELRGRSQPEEISPFQLAEPEGAAPRPPTDWRPDGERGSDDVEAEDPLDDLPEEQASRFHWPASTRRERSRHPSRALRLALLALLAWLIALAIPTWRLQLGFAPASKAPAVGSSAPTGESPASAADEPPAPTAGD